MAWVKQQPGVRFDYDCLISAAQNGNMAMCQYLINEGCGWLVTEGYGSWRNNREVGQRGDINEIRCSVQTDCPLNFKEVCIGAADSGSIGVFEVYTTVGTLHSR
jgi:hypothetical protein